jgi:sigma-70-like protein
MPSIDSLPADQRAVLELVLRRGRTYDEIAQLLSIDRAGVRQRALAAFDALGPKTRVGADRRALIADYLLDALPGGVADEVREHLLASASERAWAGAVATELEGLSERPLPEIPSNGRSARPAGPRGKSPRRAKPSRRASGDAEPAAAAEVPVAAALSNGSPRELPARRVSRRGGAILLAGGALVALALVLVFVVFTGGGAKRHAHAAARTSAPTHNSSTAPGTSAAGIKLLGQINLGPPTGARSPFGIAYVVRVQGKTGVLIRAQGLPANSAHPVNHYAVWLYNSRTDSYLLGFVKPPVGTKGQLVTGGALPANAGRFHMLLVTLETHASPKTPGHVVLQGAVKGL